VHVGVALVADSQAPEVVQVSKAALDDPALTAETRAVALGTARDYRRDAKSS